MSNINPALESLLDTDINITQAARAQGSRSHNYIRDVLLGKNENDHHFPRLIEGDFLSGSYARGTKLKPLDDIDVMMVLDGTGFRVINGGAIQDVEVEGSGESGNPLLSRVGPDTLLSSQVVMSIFQTALEELHPQSKVRDDEQAVNVWLDSYGLGIDIVPCFHLMPRNGAQDYYYIPTGGNSGGWKTTNPKIDAGISDTLHARHNRKIKNIVKLIKYWNLVSNGNRLKSYHLETVVWHIFDARPKETASLEDGVIHFFTQADKYLATACPDKTLLGGPVDQYLSNQNRELTRAKIRQTLSAFYEAYVTSPSETAQQDVWQGIFNNNLDL